MKNRIFYLIVGIMSITFSYICARNLATCVETLSGWYVAFSFVFGIGSLFPIVYALLDD